MSAELQVSQELVGTPACPGSAELLVTQAFLVGRAQVVILETKDLVAIAVPMDCQATVECPVTPGLLGHLATAE